MQIRCRACKQDYEMADDDAWAALTAGTLTRVQDYSRTESWGSRPQIITGGECAACQMPPPIEDRAHQWRPGHRYIKGIGYLKQGDRVEVVEETSPYYHSIGPIVEFTREGQLVIGLSAGRKIYLHPQEVDIVRPWRGL